MESMNANQSQNLITVNIYSIRDQELQQQPCVKRSWLIIGKYSDICEYI